MYYFNTLQATQNGTKVFQEGILLHFIINTHLLLFCNERKHGRNHCSFGVTE